VHSTDTAQKNARIHKFEKTTYAKVLKALNMDFFEKQRVDVVTTPIS